MVLPALTRWGNPLKYAPLENIQMYDKWVTIILKKKGKYICLKYKYWVSRRIWGGPSNCSLRPDTGEAEEDGQVTGNVA